MRVRDLDRRQIDREINRRERPDRGLSLSRRTFINKAILAGTAAGAASVGWFPIINTIDLAFGQQAAFRFAWLSDTHLYPKDVNTRFVDKTVRAVREIKATSPPSTLNRGKTKASAMPIKGRTQARVTSKLRR